MEYVQRRVRFVYLQSSLHENVVFSVCVRMGNARFIIFIMWNSIASLDTWYHFQSNIRCGVAVKVRSHQEKFLVIFLRGVWDRDMRDQILIIETETENV